MVCVFSDKRGFTLIELMVAIVILSVGLLALLQAVNLAISHNMVSEHRLEGTQVTDEELAKELAKGSSTAGFDAISTNTRRYTVQRIIPTSLNAFKSYSLVKTGTFITANSKQITIEAAWRVKKQRFTQSATSIITKKQQ